LTVLSHIIYTYLTTVWGLHGGNSAVYLISMLLYISCVSVHSFSSNHSNHVLCWWCV